MFILTLLTQIISTRNPDPDLLTLTVLFPAENAQADGDGTETVQEERGCLPRPEGSSVEGQGQ